jgi:transposase-like protein
MVTTERPMLDGKVEMDETYIGGRANSYDTRYANKAVVIGIRQRGGDLRFFHAKDARSGTLEKFIRENIGEDVDVLFTDDAKVYRSAAAHIRKDRKHKTIRHSFGVYVKDGGETHTNTIESAFSLLKRGITGSWHRVSAKHLQAYCEEMAFRFNRRKRPDLFTDTLRHMITAPILTFEKLTA